MGIQKSIFLILLLTFSSLANADIIDDIYTSINDTLDFRKNGIYAFVTEILAEVVQYFVVASIEFKIFSLTFAWDIAKVIIQNLSITSQLQSAWASIDSNVLNILTALKIPDALNIIMSGAITKFVFRLLF